MRDFLIKFGLIIFPPQKKTSGWLGFFYLMILHRPTKRSRRFSRPPKTSNRCATQSEAIFTVVTLGVRGCRGDDFSGYTSRVHMMHYVYRERDSEGAGINLHKPNTGAKIVTQLVGEDRGERRDSNANTNTGNRRGETYSRLIGSRQSCRKRGETGLFGSDRHILSRTPRNLYRNPIQKNFQFLYLSYYWQLFCWVHLDFLQFFFTIIKVSDSVS